MKGPDGFVQAYNPQMAVEPTCQLIVGQAVTQAVNDKQQLAPMVETIASQGDAVPDEVLADRGYCSSERPSRRSPCRSARGRVASWRPPPW